MAKPPRDRTVTDSRTYFVSVQAWGGRALLQSDRTARLLIDTLYDYRKQSKFLLHEFVIMPNHIHLLVTPAEHVTFERAMQLIKGGFSYRVGKEFGRKGEVWQRGYVDHRIRDAGDYEKHRQYILQNPERRGLGEAKDYPYCSGFPGFELDELPQRLKPQEEGTAVRHD